MLYEDSGAVQVAKDVRLDILLSGVHLWLKLTLPTLPIKTALVGTAPFQPIDFYLAHAADSLTASLVHK